MILDVRQLQKSYGKVQALGGISFSVAKGELFALLGPNGAGKTTCLEIIEGLRQPDSGQVEVCGVDALAKPHRAMEYIGVQLQSQGMPKTMTVEESLKFFASYRRCETRGDLLGVFGLEDRRKQRFDQLSGGYQRRLSLALALMHQPELLILDEPTAALDVESRNALHQLILAEKARGMTILLASHDMAEVEKLADRVMILNHGKVVAEGSPRQLTAMGSGGYRIFVQTRISAGSTEQLPPWTQQLANNEMVLDGGYIQLSCKEPGPILQAIFASLESSDDSLLDLRVERPSLEERFLEVTA